MTGSAWDPPSAGEGSQAWWWSLSLSKAAPWEMASGSGPKDAFSFLRRKAWPNYEEKGRMPLGFPSAHPVLSPDQSSRQRVGQSWGLKSMWTHSTWYHVAFREVQSHMGPEVRCGSHLVRPQSIEP